MSQAAQCATGPDPLRGVAAVAARVLANVGDGRLSALPVAIRFWDGSELPSPGAPRVRVRDPGALVHLLRAPGQLGLARAWVDQSLDVDGESAGADADLEAVLRARGAFANLHLSVADRARLALAFVRVVGPRCLRPRPVPAVEARLTGRQRSLARDRQAVRHHYDVSDRFYRLVLGPTMVYSAAYFARSEDTLEAAQLRKLDLISRKLRLGAGERFLDIGCGWGSLVVHAAVRYGVRAVGVTLSQPQAERARARAVEAGVAERVEIRVEDYRDIADGPYDKIASVGMYEHVGHDHLGRYARAVARLLRPGGLFLNDGITRLVPHAPQTDPFVARYVFPDGELHPVTDIMSALQAAGLEVRDVESLREHYALTLRHWVANLSVHRDEAIAEVGPQRERVWRLYMLGSALGFEAGEISDHQVLAARSGARHGLPLDRAEHSAGACCSRRSQADAAIRHSPAL